MDEATIRVVGKGGHERVLPLNDQVVRILRGIAISLARNGRRSRSA